MLATAPTVFIVEDDAVLLQALLGTIRQLGHQVHGFLSATTALEALKSMSCDALISDLALPEMDGIVLMREARRLKPNLPVIIVSGYGDVPSAVQALKSGAVDFITKPIDESKLFLALEQALKMRTSTLALETITTAERQVMVMVASGKSNKQIAFELGKSVRTIENHRHRLMKKLQVNSTAELIHCAFSMGLVTAESR